MAELFKIPSQDVDPETIPLRLTVVKNRHTGAAEVLGPAEEWRSLTKCQQIRKSPPARISLTIFGSKEDEVPPQRVLGDPPQEFG